MAEGDRDGWRYYRDRGVTVLLSPPVGCEVQDREGARLVALTRPSTGLLDPRARYVLDREGLLRLEFCATPEVATAEDLTASLETAVGVFQSEETYWVRDFDQAYVAEEDLVGESVDRFALDELLGQSDPDAEAAMSRLAEVVSEAPDLVRLFQRDPLVPWGLFCFADDEIITVEPRSGGLRFSRLIHLPGDDAHIGGAGMVDWALRANSASSIGCDMSLERDTDGLLLLGSSVPLVALDRASVSHMLGGLMLLAERIEAELEVERVSDAEIPRPLPPGSIRV